MTNYRVKDVEGELDGLFQALSDRNRRCILGRLAAEGPLSVGELFEPLSLAKSTMSEHLRVLEPAGLIRRTVIGRHHTCSLRTKALITAQRWVGRTAVNNLRRRRGA